MMPEAQSDASHRETMTYPNFFVIGAERCGTTSVYNYLKAHPDVFMPEVKEPRYFSENSFTHPYYESRRQSRVKDEQQYLALFESANGESAVGEASPTYLYHPETPSRIQAVAPQARFVAMFRHPVDRAYSHYMLRVGMGTEPLTFEQAVEEERPHLDSVWDGERHYLRLGFYARGLERWLAVFDRDRFCTYLNEDLNRDARAVVSDMYAFLGVDPAFEPPVEARFQMTGVPRFPLLEPLRRSKPLRRALKAVLPARSAAAVKTKVNRQMLHKPEIAPALRADLVALFRDDVLRLQDLTGHDLSSWLR